MPFARRLTGKTGTSGRDPWQHQGGQPQLVGEIRVSLPLFLGVRDDSFTDRLSGGDLLALAFSINRDAHLVDVSPFSTLGAWYIANAGTDENCAVLFHQMLA
jgi:hypothetical protein